MIDYNMSIQFKKIRAAICIGGHFRTTTLYENIKTHILDILNLSGISTDIFISTWSTEGHRDNNFGGAISIDKIIMTYKPVCIEVEKSNREYFLETFKSEYLNKKYSCPETSGDATSMWYKLWKSKEMAVKNSTYDLIFRVRSDIVMNIPLDINDVYRCLEYDTVYMPEFHGRYPEVTKEMMDHYFFGPTKWMNKILDLYLNIPEYLDSKNMPHTAEGFLWWRINSNNIPIRRFKTSYCVFRPHAIEFVV